MEFDFIVVYKLEKIHGIADALLRNEWAKSAIAILDQIDEAQLVFTEPY